MLHRWLRTARVLILLSAHEAFGMAPMEAAAAGCRVVLSDIAAHREIALDYLGESTVLVDPTDRETRSTWDGPASGTRRWPARC